MNDFREPVVAWPLFPLIKQKPMTKKAKKPLSRVKMTGVEETGTFAVRFTRRLTKAELLDFAKTYGLKLIGRNEYVPEQATFVLDFNVLAQRLAYNLEVDLAWAETRQRYKRGV